VFGKPEQRNLLQQIEENRAMLSGATGDADSHFAFGRNWASYAKLVGEPEIAEAKKGILKLIPEVELRGRTFLDIGCGSGLHALAAAELGVSRITAVDVDPDSVSTANNLLGQRMLGIPWSVEQISVFDLDAAIIGTFDVVYSWGVLHHTGNMWQAIERAASLVAPGGLFVFALYRSTRSDAFWKREKCWYAHTSPIGQYIARSIYLSAHRFNHVVRGTSYRRYVENYRSSRGMDFYHDVHDWLGGYPYETALAPEVERKMSDLAFRSERVFAGSMMRGLLGSGCDEYVYRK
jgi:2-polyprenyl-3-methyl-5-hydroxy-6-metoxy-1,4-benzoquinol methylase